MDLLFILAMTTFALAIGLGLWSKQRTDKTRRASGTEPSPLARRDPDPDLTPDPQVTDPQNVTPR